jgi:hypothetical protein
MKISYFITIAALLYSCGSSDTSGDGDLVTLDLETAIHNSQKFDLTEIAENVEFTILDDGSKESLIGVIRTFVASRDNFYVEDSGQDFPIKVFDKEGNFVGTRGRYGRGPNEYMSIQSFAVDYETDNLYISGTLSNMTGSVLVYDSAGNQTISSDSISGKMSTFFDNRLILFKESPAPYNLGFDYDPDFVSSIGTKVPLLEIYSPDLVLEKTVETIDKGAGTTLLVDYEGEQISSVTILRGPSSIISNNGSSLLVKEALSDTLLRYVGGAPSPAYKLDAGRYAAPAEAFGLNPAVSISSLDSYFVDNILEGDRFLFVTARGSKDRTSVQLVFDKNDLSKSFLATGGSEGSPGLFFDGIPFTPVYVHGNSLVGHLSALDIVDNAESLTDPKFKALASTIKEDSNPVIATIELK